MNLAQGDPLGLPGLNALQPEAFVPIGSPENPVARCLSPVAVSAVPVDRPALGHQAPHGSLYLAPLKVPVHECDAGLQPLSIGRRERVQPMSAAVDRQQLPGRDQDADTMAAYEVPQGTTNVPNPLSQVWQPDNHVVANVQAAPEVVCFPPTLEPRTIGPLVRNGEREVDSAALLSILLGN